MAQRERHQASKVELQKFLKSDIQSTQQSCRSIYRHLRKRQRKLVASFSEGNPIHEQPTPPPPPTHPAQPEVSDDTTVANILLHELNISQKKRIPPPTDLLTNSVGVFLGSCKPQIFSPIFTYKSTNFCTEIVEAHELFVRLLRAYSPGSGASFEQLYRDQKRLFPASMTLAANREHICKINVCKNGTCTAERRRADCQECGCVLHHFNKEQEFTSSFNGITHKAKGNVFVCHLTGKIHLCDTRCHGDVFDHEDSVVACSLSGFSKYNLMLSVTGTVYRDQIRKILHDQANIESSSQTMATTDFDGRVDYLFQIVQKGPVIHPAERSRFFFTDEDRTATVLELADDVSGMMIDQGKSRSCLYDANHNSPLMLLVSEGKEGNKLSDLAKYARENANLTHQHGITRIPPYRCPNNNNNNNNNNRNRNIKHKGSVEPNGAAPSTQVNNHHLVLQIIATLFNTTAIKPEKFVEIMQQKIKRRMLSFRKEFNQHHHTHLTVQEIREKMLAHDRAIPLLALALGNKAILDALPWEAILQANKDVLRKAVTFHTFKLLRATIESNKRVPASVLEKIILLVLNRITKGHLNRTPLTDGTGRQRWLADPIIELPVIIISQQKFPCKKRIEYVKEALGIRTEDWDHFHSQSSSLFA